MMVIVSEVGWLVGVITHLTCIIEIECVIVIRYYYSTSEVSVVKKSAKSE